MESRLHLSTWFTTGDFQKFNKMSGGIQTRRLWEVDVIRPLSIFLVLVLHSFTIYWGKWTPPVGFVPCVTYKWIAAFSFSFTMELFVLLSGYIFGYQIFVQKKDFNLKSLVKNKVNRLIYPALFFGVIYALIFYWQRAPFNAIYSVLQGAGHLWFLVMLFWCFILGFLLLKAEMPEKNKFRILLVAILISTVSLPLRLDKALYYLFFFYLGITMVKNQEICRKMYGNNKFLVSAALIYLVFFISYELVVPYLNSSISSDIVHTLMNPVQKYWIFAYALPGTLFFFLLTCRLMEGKITLPKFVTFASSISFGVYLVHQIIIEVLYYKTQLPSLVGPYWLPWITLLITLFGSVAIILLIRKFRK